MRVDVFDHDNRIIDDETNRRRHASERHQIEAQTSKPHRQKRRQYRHRYHEYRYESRSDVSKKAVKNRDRQEKTDQDRIANRGDRSSDEQRLIVIRRDPHILWELRAHRRQLRFYFVNDFDGVRIGLASDVEQHRRVTIGGDYSVVGRDAFADRGDVGYIDGRVVHDGDDNRIQFFGFLSLAAHDR